MSITRKVKMKDGTEYPSIKAFSKNYNLDYQLTVGRLNNGWSPDDCIDPTSKSDYRKHTKDYSKTPRYSPEAIEKMRIGNHTRWIQRATKKHGISFCYKNTLPVFKTAKTPDVKIFCVKHSNSFFIIPDKHITLLNGGCKYCWKEQVTRDSLKREEPKFLFWFNEHLSERLELRSKFQGWHEAVNLYCKIHKTSHRTTNPNNLKYGKALGCDECSTIAMQSNRLDLSSVKNKVGQMRDLPDNITILDVIFDETAEASKIGYFCSKDDHGFRPRVDLNHFKRSTFICDLCTTAGGGTAHARYLRFIESGEYGESAVIGVMEVEVEGISGLKVGVTTRTLEQRYGYSLKTIFFKLESKERHVYFLENRVKRKFANFRDYEIQAKGLRGQLQDRKRWGGDTEIFQKAKKAEIINYIVRLADDIKSNKINDLEYKEELNHFISVEFGPRDVGREKDMSNQPIAIIGIDAETNEVKYRLSSVSEASALGFGNVSSIINSQNGRQISNGIRWFRADNFNHLKIPPLKEKRAYHKPVRCIETGEEFETTALAEKAMRSTTHHVHASKITSVCRGHRKRAGGYTWEYVDNEDKN
ncbi:hypothetical protein N2382_02865 [SAR92 clade bacterium H921]|nr:hypothetical protein [SAR92 clade bacterium H921]